MRSELLTDVSLSPPLTEQDNEPNCGFHDTSSDAYTPVHAFDSMAVKPSFVQRCSFEGRVMTMTRWSLQCRTCLDTVNVERYYETKKCTCGAIAISPGCSDCDPAKYVDHSLWLCDGNERPDESEVKFIAEFVAFRRESMGRVYARLSALNC